MTSVSPNSLLICGFSGVTCEPDSHAHNLITKHQISAIMIKPCNYQSSSQLKRLIADIQTLAMYQGYAKPLLVCIDRDIGLMDIFYQDPIIMQFPNEMALASTNDLELIREVGKTIAIQYRSLGFNMFIGPVLDICLKNFGKYSHVHCWGITSAQVIKYANEFIEGLKLGGMLVCVKNFPGIGNAILDDMNETLTCLSTEQEIEATTLGPFKKLLSKPNFVDAVSISNVLFPNVSSIDLFAFMSPQIVQGLLRDKLNFSGVAIAECLEVDLVYTNWGLGQAAALAVLYAGCDMLVICESYENQLEAMKYLKLGFNDESRELILLSCISRIEILKARLNWKENLNFELTPLDIKANKLLVEMAYSKSICLSRDYEKIIPLTRYIINKRLEYSNLEFFNPNLPPYKFVKMVVLTPSVHDLNIHGSYQCGKISKSELDVTFKEFTNYLSSYSLMHTYHVHQLEYGSKGFTQQQERMIADSDLIIFVSVDARINTYQLGISKKLTIVIEHLRDKIQALSKQMLILSTSSPYEFMTPAPLGASFICCFDYSFHALRNVVKLLFGDLIPTGRILDDNDEINEGDTVVDFANSDKLMNSSFTSWDLNGILNKPIQPQPQQQQQRRQQQLQESHAPIALPQTGNRIKNENKTYTARNKSKPWIVEDFEFERDALPAFAITKTDLINEMLDIIDTHQIYRVKQALEDCDGDLKVFLIKNPTIGLIYGFMMVNFDSRVKRGEILYMCVTKWKRRHQIGESLHRHAVRYLTIQRGCLSVSLGSVFPLMAIFTKEMLEEFIKVWNYLEAAASGASVANGDDGQPNSKIATFAESYEFIEFFRSTGWESSKYGFKQIVRNILRIEGLHRNFQLPHSLNVSNFVINTADDFIELLKGFQFSFKLVDDDSISQEILSNNDLKDEEEIRFPTIYSYTNKFKMRESPSEKNTLILIGFMQGIPIASGIIYSRKSHLANFYPLIDKMTTIEQNVCGLTGLVVSDSVNENVDLVKLAMVTTCIQIIKKMGINHVILHNVLAEHIPMYSSMGFEPHRLYCADFGRKKAFEWVL